MFNPISQYLTELMMFAILGFFLGALYEPLRVSRLFIKTGAVAAGIEDFLFLAFCGLITFAYSLEFGGGEFRLFYLAGECFGAAVYFLTLGKLISIITKAVSNAVKSAVKHMAGFINRKIVSPFSRLLVKIAQNINVKFVSLYKSHEKRVTLLKSSARMRYNSITAKSRRKKLRTEKDETRNTVKAKIRKAQVYRD